MFVLQALRLVEVVRDALGVEDGQRGCVERVLVGRGTEHARLKARADDVQQRVDAGRGSSGEVDVGRIRGVRRGLQSRNVSG